MKKSEIYNSAVMAVIENNRLSSAQKATIIHELSAEYRMAVFTEEQNRVKEGAVQEVENNG